MAGFGKNQGFKVGVNASILCTFKKGGRIFFHNFLSGFV
jgi:hypothetical protein